MEDTIHKLLADFEQQFPHEAEEQAPLPLQQPVSLSQINPHQDQPQQRQEHYQEGHHQHHQHRRQEREQHPQREESEDSISPVRSRHMIAERQRRRREAELLATLKSLLPFPTKRDKLSILQGAIRYVQELQSDCVAGGQCAGDVVSSGHHPGSGGGDCSSSRVRVTVEHTALISALEHLKALGYEVDSIRLNPTEKSAELTVHPVVQVQVGDGVGLQEMLDQLIWT